MAMNADPGVWRSWLRVHAEGKTIANIATDRRDRKSKGSGAHQETEKTSLLSQEPNYTRNRRCSLAVRSGATAKNERQVLL
jgi:hypothetical protein